MPLHALHADLDRPAHRSQGVDAVGDAVLVEIAHVYTVMIVGHAVIRELLAQAFVELVPIIARLGIEQVFDESFNKLRASWRIESSVRTIAASLAPR